MAPAGRPHDRFDFEHDPPHQHSRTLKKPPVKVHHSSSFPSHKRAIITTQILPTRTRRPLHIVPRSSPATVARDEICPIAVAGRVHDGSGREVSRVRGWCRDGHREGVVEGGRMSLDAGFGDEVGKGQSGLSRPWCSV